MSLTRSNQLGLKGVLTYRDGRSTLAGRDRSAGSAAHIRNIRSPRPRSVSRTTRTPGERFHVARVIMRFHLR